MVYLATGFCFGLMMVSARMAKEWMDTRKPVANPWGKATAINRWKILTILAMIIAGSMTLITFFVILGTLDAWVF